MIPVARPQPAGTVQDITKAGPPRITNTAEEHHVRHMIANPSGATIWVDIENAARETEEAAHNWGQPMYCQADAEFTRAWLYGISRRNSIFGGERRETPLTAAVMTLPVTGGSCAATASPSPLGVR